MATVARYVTIAGRVQGVGYRAWVADEAVARGLAGWVRNRRDGMVEAVFAGDVEAVEAMLAACRIGPRAAVVSKVRADDYPSRPLTSFQVLPTA
jgi:acylphosphatase